MSSVRYPFGKVLPEIRDMILSSPEAIVMMEDAAETQARTNRQTNQNYSRNPRSPDAVNLVTRDGWTSKLSLATGSGTIFTVALDHAAVITGNIIRVRGRFPATFVAGLIGKPLRTLIETGFPQADQAIIDRVSETPGSNGKDSYLVVTIKVRTVILTRNKSIHKAIARQQAERNAHGGQTAGPCPA